ncbi:MAG: alpha-L-rhamnosidase C-terminal domain-containing protein, partial [Anaerolineae bacterium]|nr:alpha-L-rhamnosidase C-terminal domain-containing protein [Anaerolineae bacterium]
GETVLPRRSIRLFRDSVGAEGLVRARVPSIIPQMKPYFALIWILMVEDYWRWTGDQDFTHTNLNVIDTVLWYFREYIRPDGLLDRLPYWHMVDRVAGWPGGTPPAVASGGSTYLTSLFIIALDAAVRLHRQAGFLQDGLRWQQLSVDLKESVRAAAWDARAGLFLDGPGHKADGFSQHSQVMAILADVATPEQEALILRKLTSDSRIHRMKFMQSFYLARALEKAGGYAAFDGHVLSLWRDAMAKNVTTWPEYPDPTRSDCHGWSSWIAADFITCILGIQPGEPGFRHINLVPQLASCQYAQGSAPTPHGVVRMAWQRKKDGSVSLNAEVPVGIPAILQIPGVADIAFPNGGEIVYKGRYDL